MPQLLFLLLPSSSFLDLDIKMRASLLALLLLAAVLLPCGGAAQGGAGRCRTAYQLLQSPQHAAALLYAQHLVLAAGLKPLLDNPGLEGTLLAPSNAAVAAALQQVLQGFPPLPPPEASGSCSRASLNSWAAGPHDAGCLSEGQGASGGAVRAPRPAWGCAAPASLSQRHRRQPAGRGGGIYHGEQGAEPRGGGAPGSLRGVGSLLLLPLQLEPPASGRPLRPGALQGGRKPLAPRMTMIRRRIHAAGCSGLLH